MATSGEAVAKNAQALKKAMGIKGDVQPGDLTMKAREIMAPKKLPSSSTVKGTAIRGLI